MAAALAVQSPFYKTVDQGSDIAVSLMLDLRLYKCNEIIGKKITYFVSVKMKWYYNQAAREEILSTEGDPFTLLNAYNAWLQVR